MRGTKIKTGCAANVPRRSRWLTMQSSAIDANRYDFIGRQRRCPAGDNLQIAFPERNDTCARIVLFHLWSTLLWRRWIFNHDGGAWASGFFLVSPKATGISSPTRRISHKFVRKSNCQDRLKLRQTILKDGNWRWYVAVIPNMTGCPSWWKEYHGESRPLAIVP